MNSDVNINEIDIIYDRFGEPQIRILKQPGENRIVRWNGSPLGFMHNDGVFNYAGTRVGTYENGILRDTDGFTVGFGSNPTDEPYPLLPDKQELPPRGYTNHWPAIPLYRDKGHSTVIDKQSEWSDKTVIGIFNGK